MNLYGVLMAGGVGSRFWPRSRAASPKQVLNIVGENTMIQDTYNRLDGMINDDQLMVVTNDVQAKLISEQLPQLSGPSFIIEPFGRNTAPAIGLAAIHVLKQDPDGVMVVLPADHVISKPAEFQHVIQLAATHALENNSIVTLGITPYEPATGYGYIRTGERVSGSESHNIHKVLSFAEKPDLDTANQFLASGDYYWNSGMFIWKASTILQEIRDKMPAMYDLLLEISEAIGSDNYNATLLEAYEKIENISIDYGVMQQAESVYVVPADMGWNDVGSWETVHDISDQDENSHASDCEDLISVKAKGSYVYAPEKVVALVGVEDLIVVDTGDALLVCHKSHAQDVKTVVDTLKNNGRKGLL